MTPKPFDSLEATTLKDDLFSRHRSSIVKFMHSAKALEAKNHFSRVLHCCVCHLLLKSGAGYQVIPMACNSRWCERCAKYRSDLMASYLSAQFAQLRMSSVSFKDDACLYQEKSFEPSTLRHFVFTIKNCRYKKLPEAIVALGHAVRRLTQYTQEKSFTYLWHIEVVFNPGDCHPHLHMAINSYIPLATLHQIFKRAVDPFYSRIAWAERWQCSVKELTKYSTKPSSWAKAPDFAADFIWKALHRNRVIGCSRNLKLMPTQQRMGFKVLGCLEKIADNPKSEWRGVALDFMHNCKGYQRRAKATRRQIMIEWQQTMEGMD
jgi:hypothetical protein